MAGAMGSKAAQAYVCLRCADAATQVSGAGFDGWVMLLRDHFDTEDQAWPQEKLRLEGTARHVRKPPKAFMIIPPSLPVPTIRDTSVLHLSLSREYMHGTSRAAPGAGCRCAAYGMC